MPRGGAPRVWRPVWIGLLAAALAGCGGGGEEGLGEEEIVKALKLEKEGQGYTLDGDPFCVLSERFFTGSGEVDAAQGDEDVGVVVASREGNIAIEGVPSFFGPDCKQRARHRLDKLDRVAAAE